MNIEDRTRKKSNFLYVRYIRKLINNSLNVKMIAAGRNPISRLLSDEIIIIVVVIDDYDNLRMKAK